MIRRRHRSAERLAIACAAVLTATAAGAQEQVSQGLDEIVVWGRATEMIGRASSASHGVVGYADFHTRPLLRVGEFTEVVPGMLASQHSGAGKANQYFLRGLNLDHGTDFAARFDGVPVNLRSHAHGQGYLDLNFVLPEIVERVEYRKGPYYADLGDFSAAGAIEFKTYDRLDRGFVEASGGNHGYYRIVGADSRDLGAGSLLYAGEAYHHDGPWDLPQGFEKFNGYLKYSGSLPGATAMLSATGYTARWNATEQIPLRAVESGQIGRYGYIDPDLGGDTSRLGLSARFETDAATYRLYATRYRLNLFSNPTYFLEDPVHGDQIEQEDARWIGGAAADFVWDTEVAGLRVRPRAGVELQHDDIGRTNLYHTAARQRLEPIREDSVRVSSLGGYSDAEIVWTDRLRTTLGLRADHYRYRVDALQAVNSGRGSDSIVSPKFAAAFSLAEQVELYANYGRGFRSNDVRGATLREDPDSGAAVETVPALVRAEGAEIGLRSENFAGLKLMAGLFWLDLESELVYDGDAGTTEPEGATRRFGADGAVFWQANDWLVLEWTGGYARGRFRGDAEEGRYIPNAHELVFGTGATAVLPMGMTASLRVRYLGAAPLIEDNSVRHRPATLTNVGLSYDFGRTEVGLEVLNLFNTRHSDIEYFFESRLPGESEPVEDVHFHPAEPFTVRASLRFKL